MVKTQSLCGKQIASPGFGAMGMSHHRGPSDDEESLKTLARAVELGCVLWDTASIYGYGLNEELIGRFLRESKVERDSLFISSKCGFPIDFKERKQTGPVVNSKEHILEYIEGSTARLGTKPDLYYLHRITTDTPLEESIPALNSLKESGKCKYIGLSECSAETLRKACKIAHIDVIQLEYSPWCLDHETDGLIDAAKELGVSIVAYSPLGRGVLTGKFRDASQFKGPNDNRGDIPKYSEENLQSNLRIVDELEKIAAEKKCSVGQLCIAWVAHSGAIPIPGTKQISRLEENWESRNVDLSDSDMARIRSIITEHAPQGARYGAQSLAQVGK